MKGILFVLFSNLTISGAPYQHLSDMSEDYISSATQYTHAIANMADLDIPCRSRSRRNRVQRARKRNVSATSIPIMVVWPLSIN
jgi:hypothetical protein